MALDQNSANVNPLNGYSARIKKLYIELQEYAYFHSPSEIDDIDPRFTGRVKVVERLKNLFTDHQTPSGAYLVTGYRGAGKTSVVSRALSEISSHRGHSHRGSSYLRLTAPLIPVALLGGLFSRLGVVWLLMACTLALLLVLAWRDPKFPNLARPEGRLWWKERSLSLLRALDPGIEREPRGRTRVLVQNALVVLVVICIGGFVICWLGYRAFWPRLLTYLIVLFGYLVLHALVSAVLRASLEIDVDPNVRPPVPTRSGRLTRRRPIGKAICKVGHSIWMHLKNRFRYANRVFIKVNLSQDDIQEIDILRLIAKNIYLQYRQFVSGWQSDLHWKLLRVVLLVLVVGVIYNLEPIVHLNSGLKQDLHITCYFPSQGLNLLPAEHETYFQVLDDTRREDRSFDSAYFRRELEDLVRKTRTDEPRPLSKDEHAFDHVTSQDLKGRLEASAMTFTVYLDTFIQLAFRETVTPALEGLWSIATWLPDRLGFASRGSGDPRFDIGQMRKLGVPRHLDYLFVFYLILFGSLFHVLMRWPPAGLVSHALVVRRLSELNDMIETEVTRQQGGVIAPGSLLTFNLGPRRSKTYPKLSARDIEKHLLEILSLIERIPRLTVRPEFIVIFDELDKIQPHLNLTISEKEEEVGEYRGREFTSVETERARQHKILSLVSNLKHFLTTAPAKFVFIAGREMFDAALADVSDRHYFMGSVFNEVLHVPSFHSDTSDDRLPDITSLTEQYVSRFLIPRRLWYRGLCLRTYREYLESELKPGDENAAAREKVLYELHNFVTYITYRSNGAPKKITKAVERYLERMSEDVHRNDDNLVIGRSSNSYYLFFDYYDQYTFGLITYLGSPLIFALNRAIKDYGDKILVSSSFLLDHVYKFHGHGFSWRNLELLPEIVDINRAPQLRELIGHIMDFLGKSAITQIASGLYDFKFNRKIAEEISFLSKLSEDESAAFNFTLDESLAIKRHFNHKLQVLLGLHNDSKPQEQDRDRLVNSIAFVRMILGDLHFYDGELDAAIIEYMEAVQPLRGLRARDLQPDTLVLMVRNFLKLGLAFERKKSFDSALATYGRISALVSSSGELRKQLVGWPEEGPQGIPSSEPDQRYAQSIFEGSRIILQPLYARLELAEKLNQTGLSAADLNNVQRDFKSLVGDERIEDRYLVVSEFHSKIADILYFKNGPVPKAKEKVYCEKSSALCTKNKLRNSLLDKRRQLPCAACSHYHEALQTLGRNFLRTPFSPFSTRKRREHFLVQVLSSFENGAAARSSRASATQELAQIVASLGDTFLACTGSSELDRDFLVALAALLRKTGKARSKRLRNCLRKLGTPNKLEEAVACFVVAAILYRRSSNSQAGSQELTKVLWLIREQLAVAGTLPTDTSLATEIAPFTRVAIEESFRCHKGTHRLEIEKLKEILERPGTERPFIDTVNLGRLSINSSIMEILVVYDEIKSLLRPKDIPAPIDRRATPYALFQSVFCRIHMLRHRARLNHDNLIALGVTSLRSSREAYLGEFRAYLARRDPEPHLQTIFSDIQPASVDRSSLVEFLITDSLYCLHEIIRFMAIYGSSYMASHSMRAAAHRAMAKWCDYYYAYVWIVRYGEESASATEEGQQPRTPQNPEEERSREHAVRQMESRLQRLVGQGDMVDLSPAYHAEMALLHYRAAREVHSEGKSYHDLINKMYYLNDDFADQLEHFCAGLERFRINSGDVDKRIDKLLKRRQATTLYNVDAYTDSGDFFQELAPVEPGSR